MNRNLLALSIVMFVLGVSFNLYVLSLIGVLLFFPALLSSRRPPVPPGQPTRPTPRRMPPPAPVGLQATPVPHPSMAQVPVSFPSSVTTQSQSYSPALFPTAMFPSLSQMGSTPPPAQESQPSKPPERDEVIEMAAIMALMKLAFG